MAAPYFAQTLRPNPLQSSVLGARLRPDPLDDLASNDDERSLLSLIGGVSLSGLNIFGNALDLPGSMVRDIGSGLATGDWDAYNPFDQLLTPFTAENRQTGRDLLTAWGLTQPNDPTRWEWSDVAGFGAEVLSDPLFWTPAGAVSGAVSKGAKAAFKAVPEAATKKLAQSSLGKAAGETGRLASRLFDARVMGRQTAVGQQAARKLHAEQLANQRQTLKDVTPILGELERRGLMDPAAARSQRDILEGVSTGGPEMPQDLVEQARTMFDSSRAELEPWGLSRDLEDVIQYAPRRMGQKTRALYDALPGSGKDPRPLGARNPAAVGREDVWKGFTRGSNHVDTVLTDPQWQKLMDQSKTRKEAVELIADAIEEKYGKDILPSFQLKDDRGRLLFTLAGTEKTIPISRELLEKNGMKVEEGVWEYFRNKPFGKGDPDILTLVEKHASRYEELAKVIVRNPELRQEGLFTNHWLRDAYEHVLASKNQASALNATADILKTPGVLMGSKALFRKVGEKPTTLGDILTLAAVPLEDGTREMARRLGVSISDKPSRAAKQLNALRKQVIAPDVAEDLKAVWGKTKLPSEFNSLVEFADSLTALFKAGVLTHPARYVRDIMSGQIRNIKQGMFDLLSAIQTHGVLQARVVKGLEHLPAVQKWLAKNNLPATAENATNALRHIYASMKASPVFQNLDTPSALPAGVGGVDDLLEMIPGRQKALDWRKIWRTAIGREKGTTLNPFDVRGVGGRTETTFGPAAAGDIIGRYTDDMNRMVPFLNLLKKGFEPEEAMRRIQWAQVNYDPRTFTEFEKRVLKRLLPFYSFTSRQIPYVINELIRNPGGRLGQIIRAQNVASGRGAEPMPEYVAQSGGIPLGTLPDGTDRYLAGLNLMHENALAFLGGGAQGTLTELGSHLTPWLKAPIEWAAGESFFQRGPSGGRDLLEMDPTIGRTISNVSQLLGGQPWEDASGRAHPFINQGVEFLAANSPLSRLFSTARTITDPRKYEGSFPGLPAALNTLSGLRVSDISPAAQDAVIREQLDAYARENLGARNYSTAYVSQSTIEANEKANPKLAADQKNFMALQRALQQRRKKRVQEKERQPLLTVR